MIFKKINNLASIIQLYNSKPTLFPKKVLDDLTALKSLVEELDKVIEKVSTTQITNNFLIGYEFERLHQEFDLLKAVKVHQSDSEQKIVINIELKKSSAKKHEIEKQLKNHQFYFNRVGIKYTDMYLFGYCEDKKQFFEYAKKSGNEYELIKVSSERIYEILYKFRMCRYFDIDEIFKVENILISPLNNWEEFVKKNYLLTEVQRELRDNLLTADKKIIRVTGSAGSGKTLVLYDVVRNLVAKEKEVVVIPCHTKINAHSELAKSINFTTIGIGSLNYKKNYSELVKANYIFVDEAQRISRKQISYLLSKFDDGNLERIFFFYDELQWLKSGEKYISKYLKTIEPDNSKDFNLKGSIRSNYFITLFAMNLLYSKDKNKNDNYKDTIVELIKKRKNFLFRDLKRYNVKPTSSVNIYYFDNHQSAREFMSTTPETLRSTPLYFTPSKNGIHDGKKIHYSNPINDEITDPSRNPHKYMGREFDSVTVPMDSKFSYDKEGNLVVKEKCNNSDPVQMLYEIVTRARKELNIVVIDNLALYEKLEQIKQNTEKMFRDGEISN